MRRSPFQRTPALPPARKVRLRLSPHFPGRRQPYGLEQNRSVPPALPAAWGSWVKSNVVGDANVAVPGPLASLAPSGKALLAESGRLLASFQPPSGLRKPAFSFSSRGTPVPGSPGPRAQASGGRPSTRCRGSSASSARPTLPPIAACRQVRSTLRASPDARRRRRKA